MSKLRLHTFLLFLIVFGANCWADTVGLLIVATGKYIDFVPSLIASARKHFCTNHDVTYFVFTDGQIEGEDIVRIQQERLGWPYDTLMRLSMYDYHADLFHDMDYLFATDADMRFESEVGDEILSDRVATQHPGYVGRRGTYESRRQSTAYVDQSEGSHYFAGGFNGGSREEFLKMAHEKGRIIAAVCHGPQLLISAGILKGKKATAYYSIADDIRNAGAEYIDAPVVIDGNIITSPHYKYMHDFMKAVLSKF